MSQKEIHLLLDKLKKEIEILDSNSELHLEINQLIVDIEHHLKLREATVVDNIRNYIERMEIEHPRITNILSELMIKLINIGI